MDLGPNLETLFNFEICLKLKRLNFQWRWFSISRWNLILFKTKRFSLKSSTTLSCWTKCGAHLQGLFQVLYWEYFEYYVFITPFSHLGLFWSNVKKLKFQFDRVVGDFCRFLYCLVFFYDEKIQNYFFFQFGKKKLWSFFCCWILKKKERF